MCINHNEESVGVQTTQIPLANPKLPLEQRITPPNKEQQDGATSEFHSDILTTFSAYTRKVLHTLNRLLHTGTQAHHLAIVVSLLSGAFLLLPNSDEVTLTLQDGTTKRSTHVIPDIWKCIYLSTFALHFGAQIWMTFVSGLSLYFSLPRHSFGAVQQVLFPLYFLYNALLSFVTLAIFWRINSTAIANRESSAILQLAALTLCFMLEGVVRLFLATPIVRLMSVKYDIEKRARVGDEVGYFAPKSLSKCPHFMGLHMQFRRLHGIAAVCNMTSMACSIVHLYYLAQKLQL